MTLLYDLSYKTKRFLSFIGALNLNKKNDAGQTLLHQAIENNQTDVVKYLVDKGADLNLKDSKGNTALHIATQKDQTDVVKYLTDKGAKLDLQNNDNKIPLDLAAQSPTNIAKTLYEEINLNKSGNIKTQKKNRVKPNKKPKTTSPVIEEKTQDKKTPSNWQAIAPTSQQHSETKSVKASAYRATETQNTPTENIVITKPQIPETPYQNSKATQIGASTRQEVPNNTLAAAAAVANDLESKQKLPDHQPPKSPPPQGMTRVTIKKVTRNGPGKSNTR
jgi:hypothetical protein